MDSLVDQAREFAKKKHLNHYDDEGKPYFDAHLEQVVAILKTVTNDQNILAAAYLHDVIEDTDTSYQEVEEHFGKRVADLVHEVTHEGHKDEKGYYFPRLHSKDAILLKFADRLSNLSRMHCWPEKRQQQYLKRSKFWRSEI